MAYIQRYLIVCVTLFALWRCGVMRAEGSTDRSADIALEFTVFAPRAVKGMAYFPEGEKKPVSGLKFYNSYRSPVYAYKGGTVLRFYDEKEAAAASEAFAAATAASIEAGTPPPPPPVLRPIALCAIPEGVTKAFLLFIPRPSVAIGGLKYDIFVMDDGETGVPPGHFVIINASNLEFIARINNVDTAIHRGVSPIFKSDRGLVILLAVRTEPEYHKLMIADQWDLGPRQRNLLIFFPPKSPTALLPEIVRLNDEIPEDKDKVVAVGKKH